MPKPLLPPVHYRVDLPDPRTHRYHLTLTIARPAARQNLSLPVWIPGSYLVREFSRHLVNLRARQGGRAVVLTQLSKCQWQALCRRGEPLVLHYEVVASDRSVRAAWLDATRGFFNATSLCLRVHGQEEQPHGLQVLRPAACGNWQLATALTALKAARHGFGSYQAAGYDELADCPVEMGVFQSLRFVACGTPHRLVVSGAPASFDSARLLRDVRRICEEQIRFWSEDASAPFAHYTFLLNAADDGYGGLEHKSSTALICNRRDLPRLGQAKAPEGYTTLLGLFSHEYFHAWNVKRMRPAEFTRYDYTQENYTELLWFFEGFTSYYDDLLLRRAGLIDQSGYLKLLAKTINQVLQTPGRQVQSVAQASFDAWVRYYRPDENTPGTTVSYYTKGALVALCLDLSLRSSGRCTLDDVMRALWRTSKGGPITEAAVRQQLRRCSGRHWGDELHAWVHGTGELPLAELLAAHGVQMKSDTDQPAQRLGLRVQESGSVRVKLVLAGSAAERAGFMAGDEWLGVEVAGEGWRLAKLDDLALYAGAQPELTALVARDARLLRLALSLPAPDSPASSVQLSVTEPALADQWLGLP
ncbi:M61 family metallopeptidase [Comamonas sp. NLF-1-9]|uniref:M61 family metallopeptidase n=1 Tax=Comamonas sp. NLF-1-9 TaxID=2853163 RepID=UPI001C46BAE4|nr:peptidase M61 [Comamonas sp. NLF-1-9]QXL84399.1 peptidase M61 [Comamonas sp. NLF-1-9]